MTTPTDWSAYMIQLYPLSRELEAALNMRDWQKASELSQTLGDVANDLFRTALRMQYSERS